MNTQTIHITHDQAPLRIDHFLSDTLHEITRSQIKRLVINGSITVNKKKIKPNYTVKPGDTIDIDIPPPLPSSVEPEEIPLEILFEDHHIIVVNKPSGMTVHPAQQKKTGTLVNALLFHCTDLSGIGGVERPGIVHRLDKDTSGVIVCAKNDKAHTSLCAQFKKRTIKKIYIALVSGVVKKDTDTIEIPIGRHVNDRKKISTITKKGKQAITIYEVVERFSQSTLLQVKILTGRTHQIRVHLASQGHPVLGDPLYGQGSEKKARIRVERLMLHAETIGFTHPITKEQMEWSAPLPEYFTNTLHLLTCL